MAANNNKPKKAETKPETPEVADVKAGTISTSDNLLDDITRSGRHQTEVSTETKVEDRTEEPARHMVMSYHSKDEKLDNGTILTTYGEAKSK